MWADHGDSVSQQYAGTNALKSDITRNGKRKFTGLMKDGNVYNTINVCQAIYCTLSLSIL